MRNPALGSAKDGWATETPPRSPELSVGSSSTNASEKHQVKGLSKARRPFCSRVSNAWSVESERSNAMRFTFVPATPFSESGPVIPSPSKPMMSALYAVPGESEPVTAFVGLSSQLSLPSSNQIPSNSKRMVEGEARTEAKG